MADDLKPETMKRGARYNWKGQPERLIYTRKFNGWHQFQLIDDPKRRAVWCEVMDVDLHMLEETTGAANHSERPESWEAGMAECKCRVPPELRIPLRELVAMKVELARDVERRKVPPCMECGAETATQAETMCRCSGDKDDCHGCQLWDSDAAQIGSQSEGGR